MEFKIIEKIDFHAEMDIRYLNSLNVCGKFLSDVDKKRGRYCHDVCQNKCYEKQKKYFEQYVSCVRNPSLMYIENTKRGLTYHKPSEMNERYASSDKFIKVWIKDDSKRTYSIIDFVPDIKKCESDVYNTFTGYRIEKIYVKQDETKRNELIAPILDHFYNSFEKHEADYIMKVIAFIIKHPMNKNKNGVSLIIQGLPGTGKSSLIENFVVKVIGDDYYKYTAQPEDIFGKHAEGSQNKILINLDEVEGKTTFDLSELMKSHMTQIKLTVNPKGIRPYTISNYAVTMFTTNKSVPMKIEIGDRRYCLIKIKNTYICNKNHFDYIEKYMSRPDVLSAWYDHLMSLDVEHYDFTKYRPITQLYKDIVDTFTPTVYKFIDYMLGTDEDDEDNIINSDKIPALMLFGAYQEWKTATNHKDDLNLTSFGRVIIEINGITKKRMSAGQFYCVDKEKVKNYFISKNLFGYSSSSLNSETLIYEKLRKQMIDNILKGKMIIDELDKYFELFPEAKMVIRHSRADKCILYDLSESESESESDEIVLGDSDDDLGDDLGERLKIVF